MKADACLQWKSAVMANLTAWAYSVRISFSVSNAGLFCLMWIFVQNRYLLFHVWNEKQSSYLEICPSHHLPLGPTPTPDNCLSLENPPSPTGNSPAPVLPVIADPAPSPQPASSPSPHSRLSHPQHYRHLGPDHSVL